MQKTTIVVGMAWAAMAIAAPACKKQDDKAKPAAGKAAEARKQPEPAAKPAEPPAKPVEPAKPFSPEERLAHYQACWGHFNSGDMAALGACYADDAVSEQLDSGMPPLQGRAAMLEMFKAFKTGFPDLRGDQALVLVNGNKALSANLVVGTHSGELKMGPQTVPSTNKKVGYLMAHLVEYGDDNVAHKEWAVSDAGTMMGQLGLNPEPHRAAMDKLPAPTEVVIAKDDEVEKANLEAYKAMLEAWNKHDKAMVDMMTPDVVNHDYMSAKDQTGTKEVLAQLQMIWKGFSDAKGEIVDLWAAGPYTVAVVKNTATNDGDVKEWKLKKTGKPVAFTSIEVTRWEGGKVKETWLFANGMAMATQLGMAPPPGAAPAGEAAAPAPADKK